MGIRGGEITLQHEDELLVYEGHWHFLVNQEELSVEDMLSYPIASADNIRLFYETAILSQEPLPLKPDFIQYITENDQRNGEDPESFLSCINNDAILSNNFLSQTPK